MKYSSLQKAPVFWKNKSIMCIGGGEDDDEDEEEENLGQIIEFPSI